MTPVGCIVSAVGYIVPDWGVFCGVHGARYRRMVPTVKYIVPVVGCICRVYGARCGWMYCARCGVYGVCSFIAQSQLWDHEYVCDN